MEGHAPAVLPQAHAPASLPLAPASPLPPPPAPPPPPPPPHPHCRDIRLEFPKKGRRHGVVSKRAIAQLVGQYGAVEDIFVTNSGLKAFVRLETSAGAAKAHALHGRTFGDALGEACPNGLGRKRVFVHWSDRSPVLAETSRVVLPDTVLVTERPDVPGTAVLLDFLTAEEECALLALFDARPWALSIKRRVQHYGFEFRYDGNNVDPASPIVAMPPSCVNIMDRLLRAGATTMLFDQLTVQEYLPGQGISAHVDTHSAFDDEIVSVSLGGLVVMRMRNATDRSVDIVMPPRSALVLAGEGRYAWSHAIPHRSVDRIGPEGQLVPRQRRVSLTYRRVRPDPQCACPYSAQCDTQGGGVTHCLDDPDDCDSGMAGGTPVGSREGTVVENGGEANEGCEAKDDGSVRCGAALRAKNSTNDSDPASLFGTLGATPYFEVNHVHRLYDTIGAAFSHTRTTIVRPRVDAFLSSLQHGVVVADVGCGGGQYLSGLPAGDVNGAGGAGGANDAARYQSFTVIGFDICKAMVRLGVRPYCQTVQSSCLPTFACTHVFKPTFFFT